MEKWSCAFGQQLGGCRLCHPTLLERVPAWNFTTSTTYSICSSTAFLGLVSSRLVVKAQADIFSDPFLPQVPKGPNSAYTLFVKDWFAKNRSSASDPSTGKLNVRKISGQMGSAWAALSDSAKETYSQTAKELKKAFDMEYKSWYESLSPETIKEIEAATGKKVGLPGGKMKYKAEQAGRPGNPGRPMTAFFEFMRDFRVSAEVEGMEERDGVTAVARKAGEKWREMSEAEKQVSRSDLIT